MVQPALTVFSLIFVFIICRGHAINLNIEKIQYVDDSGSLYSYHPDAHIETPDLIDKYDYNAETHKITTKDDYILQVHRINGQKNVSNPTNRPVVLLMHGILGSSADWVIAGPGRALGYLLADHGYDVWIGNARGNYYSRGHASPAITDSVYWDFSWHEIGTLDLPAMIDYILGNTSRETLFYLAHSQGSTAFFVMSCELPEYQEKVEAMHALAPIVYMSHSISPPFRLMAPFAGSIQMLTHLIGKYEFAPTGKGLKTFAELVCSENALTQPICTNIIFLFTGFNSQLFNKTLLPMVLGHVPAGASVKQFVHYAQLINSGHFRQFDYGFWKNTKKYNKISPPNYNLSSIVVPVSLYFSSNDWLAHKIDVEKLYKELGNPVEKFLVPHEKFNHLDYLWATNAKTLLYDRIIDNMPHANNHSFHKSK